MRRIYLDNAATTPLDSEVRQAMEPYLDTIYGNPSSLHWHGQQARAAIDRSREIIANAIGARFREVIFTGSATEANNLAVRGAVRYAREAFEALHSGKPMKAIVSAIEHDSIMETVGDIEKDGVEVVRIPVDAHGLVDVQKIIEALDERTVMVSIMYANNEIGTIQPIKAIADGIKRFRMREHAMPYYPLFHTDAVQAFQFLTCNVGALGVDLMTLSAHKLYGPKGVGMLYARTMDTAMHKKGDRVHLIHPRVAGGGQEFGMRSGTENVAAIVGFAKAAELAVVHREEEGRRIGHLRDMLWEGIRNVYPNAIINGIEVDSRPTQPKRFASWCAGVLRGNDKENVEYDNASPASLPNILNVHFPGKKGGELLIALDMHGIAVSSGSACAAFSAKPSPVLMALGFAADRAGGSLRFSLGRHTTADDVARAIDGLRVIM